MVTMKLRQAKKIIKKSTVLTKYNNISFSLRICNYYYNKQQEDKALNTISKHKRKHGKKLQDFIKTSLLEEIKKRLENEYIGGSLYANNANK